MVFFFSLHLSNIFPCLQRANIFFLVTKKEKSLFEFPKTKNLFPCLPRKKKKFSCPTWTKISTAHLQRKFLSLSSRKKNLFSCLPSTKISFPITQKQKSPCFPHHIPDLFSCLPRTKITFLISQKKKNSFPVSQK